MTVYTPSDFVETLFASWRLPPKAAVSAYRRHSFVEGIRNGGLDLFKAAAGRMGVSKGCCTTAFFLLPSSGRSFVNLFFSASPAYQPIPSIFPPFLLNYLNQNEFSCNGASKQRAG